MRVVKKHHLYKLLLAVIINPIHSETSRLISFLSSPFFPPLEIWWRSGPRCWAPVCLGGPTSWGGGGGEGEPGNVSRPTYFTQPDVTSAPRTSGVGGASHLYYQTSGPPPPPPRVNQLKITNQKKYFNKYSQPQNICRRTDEWGKCWNDKDCSGDCAPIDPEYFLPKTLGFLKVHPKFGV